MTYNFNNNTIAGYTYTYDANGNITKIKEGNTVIASYIYDSLNQLQSVNYRSRNLFFTYSYDNCGIITSQSIQNLHPTYGYPIGTTETITYTYDDSEWKDKLTAYNGDTITYDNIGNPLSYRDGMSMTWQNGRELASIKDNNNITYSFTYNLNGLRTKKSENINNTNTYYYYDSNNNLVGMKKGSNTVLYYYDSDGGLVSMSVGGSSYLFVKNLQGDITKILDNSGDVVATYAYDAWGKILAETEDSSIAGLNPFRYRGYIYDIETELYYLQSRYYDPLTGRFLNADSPNYTDTYSGSPLSTNMFAYCENNPINHLDSRGTWIDANNYFLKSFTIPILLPILLGNTKLAANIIAAVPILYLYLPARFYLLSLFNKVKYEKYKFSSDKMIGVKILNSKGFHDYLIKEFSIRKRVDSSNRSLIKEQIKKLIKSGIKNKRYPKKGKDSISFYEDSHDLYLSIGAGKCAIRLQFKKTIKKNYQKWKITISLSDKYNFESWDETKNNELTKALNNIVLGIPMTVGILTPYKWKYTYTYTEIIKVK